MLKRASKITALLVAAATTMSIVPASAATTRLGTEEGEFTQAFSYAEGKFVYDGYRTDDDDTAIYFNDGEKEEEVDDYDDYDFEDAVRYGKKYVTVKDGDDTYLLDLSTGKIDDDESLEDKADNVRSKLKTNLKKADRYEDFKSSGNDIEEEDCYRILEGKYGEVWYKYEVTGDSDAKDAMENGKKYIGVVNEDNKYLDLSYVANMSIYSPAKEKTVKFDNFGDSEEFDKEGNEVTLKLVDVNVIDQDDDYLYAITTVKVEGDEKEEVKEEVKNAEVPAEGTTEEKPAEGTTEEKPAEGTTEEKPAEGATEEKPAEGTTEEKPAEGTTEEKPAETGYQYFFQKISKSQGDKKDGAYTPKSVSSYQIDDGAVFKEDGDRTDAYDLLIQAAGIEKADKEIVNVEVDESKSMIHVAQLDESDKMKVYHLKYKKDKVDAPEKDKVDAYIVLKDGDTDEDIVDTDDEDAKPYSVDIDGNLWILGKGKIYKYDGDEFKELYTCDRSINNLDVYDEKNLIAWEKDEEVFAVLQNGKGSKDGGTEDPGDDKPVKTDKTGWDKNEDGTWSFYDATGVQVKASWVNVQGTWYYLKEDGIMATGWLQEGGNWYYLNASGAMQTGWLNDNGTWYYLNASGAMAYGWLQDTDGRWYYLSTTSGAMLTNTTIDGCVLGANGAWIR